MSVSAYQSNPHLFKITPIRAFNDNYIWCIHNDEVAVVVDPGDASPVKAFLTEHKLRLTSILITHHHFDHVGGISELCDIGDNITVFGPVNPKIREITNRVKQGDNISLPELELTFSIIETPGHTMDHIVYLNNDNLFCGDTLFSGGCGRMFEGTAEVFYASLEKLRKLPAHTKVYCTHEYTQANLAFAKSVEPHNDALKDYSNWVNEQRANDNVTLPSNIGQEHAINPFFRCHTESLQATLLGSNSGYGKGFSSDSESDEQVPEIQTFAKLRKMKDSF